MLTAKSIVEYLVVFERGGSVVGDLDAGREPVEDAVAAQHRVALRRDQHSSLRVAKYIVLFQYTLQAYTLHWVTFTSILLTRHTAVCPPSSRCKQATHRPVSIFTGFIFETALKSK